MKTVLQCAVMLVVALISVPGYTAERLALYDDFNATHIDPDKWFGAESSLPGGAGTEALRQSQDNRLRLVYRGYGKTDSDSGRPRNELLLIFRNSAAVTAIQATVQVNDVAATHCPGNPEATRARAMLVGRFFSTAPGSQDNDVAALISIQRESDATDPPDVLRTVSVVFLCTNVGCSAGSLLHFKHLGTVKRGEMARLRVQWDQENHRFIFQRDDNPEVIASYAVSDTAAPGIQFKALDIVHQVPNCTATPRPMAFIEAWFDDVKVNASAAPHAE